MGVGGSEETDLSSELLANAGQANLSHHLLLSSVWIISASFPPSAGPFHTLLNLHLCFESFTPTFMLAGLSREQLIDEATFKVIQH